MSYFSIQSITLIKNVNSGWFKNHKLGVGLINLLSTENWSFMWLYFLKPYVTFLYYCARKHFKKHKKKKKPQKKPRLVLVEISLSEHFFLNPGQS